MVLHQAGGPGRTLLKKSRGSPSTQPLKDGRGKSEGGLTAVDQRRAVCRTEGRLLLSGQRNSGRSPRKRQSREEHIKEGQLGLLPSMWASHSPTTLPQCHLDSQGCQAN